MLRRSAALLAAVLLAGCGKDIRSKEKIQEAILSRLETRSGLDLKSLDVTTTAVSFEKNIAYATVAFHPKDDPRVNSGMIMKYTLEDRDGKWVVVSVDPGHGASSLPAGHLGTGEQLPPGHPRIGSAPQQGASEQIR